MMSRLVPVSRWIAVAVAVAGLAACGGGGASGDGPPIATISNAGGALAKNEALVVRFSEPMDAASLKLGGDLGAQAVPEWSAQARAVTLRAPEGGWPVGAGRRLVLDGADGAGTKLATLDARYDVRLEFGTFAAATALLGQQDFTRGDANRNGSVAANTLKMPTGSVAVAPDGKLFVADTDNSRVLVFDRIPSSGDASAAFVLGQPDMLSATTGTAKDKLSGPVGSSVGHGKLLVSDHGNHRVLLYGSIPDAQGTLPQIVIGQQDFMRRDKSCAADRLDTPEAAVITEDGKVIVADAGNNRVLIWNQPPVANGQPADLVLGQSDATHCAANDDDQNRVADVAPTGRTFAYPAGLWSDGRRLVVADVENNRVLIWNTFPTSDFQPADVVLGQKTFFGHAPNDVLQDGSTAFEPSASTFHFPYQGVSSNGVQLAVTDWANQRVLIWNTFPTRNFQPADQVIGHGSFSGHVENDANEDAVADLGPAANVLFRPGGVLFHRDTLIVSDSANHRVLVFRSR